MKIKTLSIIATLTLASQIAMALAPGMGHPPGLDVKRTIWDCGTFLNRDGNAMQGFPTLKIVNYLKNGDFVQVTETSGESKEEHLIYKKNDKKDPNIRIGTSKNYIFNINRATAVLSQKEPGQLIAKCKKFVSKPLNRK